MADEKKQIKTAPFFLKTKPYLPKTPSPEREEELKALLRLIAEKRKEHIRQGKKLFE